MPNPNSRDLKAVTKALANPTAAGALEHLVERGCDREELIRLIARLRHAHAAKRRIVRKLKRLARAVERAAKGIRDLPGWEKTKHLGLPDDPEAWLLDCSHDLQLLADSIRARLAETDSGGDDTRIDRASNSIIRYVMDKTGQPDTAEAAVLIGAVRLERAPAEFPDAVRTPRGAAGLA